MGFTNNYRTIVATTLPGAPLSANTTPSDLNMLNGGSITNTAGTVFHNVYAVNKNTSLTYYAIGLSNSTIPPSPEDYQDTEDVVYKSAYTDTAIRDGLITRYPGKCTFSTVYTNTTDTAQTVAKIFLTARVSTIYYVEDKLATVSGPWILIASELLPTPVTVEPGETATFSLTLDWTKLVAEATAN